MYYQYLYLFTLFSFLLTALGTCLPVYGKKQGEHCSRDTDCESGFVCMDNGAGKSCQTPIPGDKGLGKQNIFSLYY